LWDYAQRFGRFYKFEAVIKTMVDGVLENWPVAASYIRRAVGERWQPEFHGAPGNFEEASLRLMPRLVYEKFVRPYSEKQWGIPARGLSASLAGRFDVREDDEPRLMRHRHQGIPVSGYADWTTRMLSGIPVILNFDFLRRREEISYRRKLIFTGPVDEYFTYDLGKLAYRGQRREHVYQPEVDRALAVPQVNNPDPANGPHIRTIEWKQMMPPEYASRIRGTVTTQETPFTPEHPDGYEYPFPDAVNTKLYQAYRSKLPADGKILVCGRLGEYRYYDMDQAIARAMHLASELLND
jgi:UDP-galactopyranose mutase